MTKNLILKTMNIAPLDVQLKYTHEVWFILNGVLETYLIIKYISQIYLNIV